MRPSLPLFKALGMFFLLSTPILSTGSGCSETLDETCGRGEPLEANGETYCIYRQEIIEEGFDCPQDLQASFQFEGGTVCAPSSNNLPPAVEDHIKDENFGELISAPEGWMVGETPDPNMPNTSNSEAFPSVPTSCTTGLPWQVTQQNATMTYAENEEAPSEGSLSITLDGEQGGEVFMRLPMGTGDFSMELDFRTMLQSKWGVYELSLAVHDPNASQTYALADLSTIDSSGRRACFGTIHSEGEDLSSGGGSNCEERADDSNETTDGTIILRREGDNIWLGGYGMGDDLDMPESRNPIDATQPLDFLISVRGNTRSTTPVVTFDHLRASDTEGRLYDDAFTCDSTSPDTNFTPAAPLEWELNRGTGPRPTE